jgi:hypothetical protein
VDATDSPSDLERNQTVFALDRIKLVVVRKVILVVVVNVWLDILAWQVGLDEAQLMAWFVFFVLQGNRAVVVGVVIDV